MSKKTKRFNKKEGFRFTLMHRSQQDPLYHDEENGSKFILHPADRKTALALETGALQQEGTASYVSSEAAAKSKRELAEKRTKDLGSIREYREVDEYGLPLDGYDYTKHLSTVGGGAFISADGSRVENAIPVVEKAPLEEDVLQMLPETVFASNQEQPRLLEAITLRPEGMDPEMKKQLGLVSDEEEEDVESEATGEWGDLQDDFMVQLVSEGVENMGDEEDENQVENEGEFDFDAHMARLMKQAEEEDALAEGDEDEEEEDEFDRLARRQRESNRPDRPVRDVDEHFDTVLAAEYENDDDDDDDDYYQEEGDDMEQYDTEQLLSNLKAEDYDDELEEFGEEEEEDTEGRFDNDEIDEVEEPYRPTTAATTQARKTMDSESHTTMTRKSKRPQTKLISQDDPVFLQAINEFLEQKASDQSLGEVAAPPPAAETLRLVKSNSAQEPFSTIKGEEDASNDDTEEEDEEGEEPPTYEEMIKLWGTYSVTTKPQFDCETIISTRSTTDNLPTQIEITGTKSKKAKKQNQPPQPPPIIEEERSLEDDDDDDHGTVDSVTREIARMALQGLTERSKNETAEERKARKNKLKEMKKERRMQKKSTKEAFKRERAHVLHALTAENAPRPGVSEFKI